MQMSWQTETDHLVCQWSEAGERVQYNAAWLRDVSMRDQREDDAPAVADWTALSPFGGRWFAPGETR